MGGSPVVAGGVPVAQAHRPGACPVCGLTRSVALAWRGRWRESFAAHRLGVPLVVAVAARVLVRPVPGSRAGSRPRSRAA
ncbi:DUF2752 domain-containing protein [Pseudonocardia benzenivorans]